MYACMYLAAMSTTYHSERHKKVITDAQGILLWELQRSSGGILGCCYFPPLGASLHRGLMDP